ncbi:hypothetical protein N7517_000287 [Penicillium concentricum]|uniref:Uncharacterized protein n=1 Tax=Penicillium concentricum TaxID=293559 RepID=A0A9W9VK65_9EURO|nr:uncharacterized protein N7517_000287 [Penicillium concentricum]KAJ5382376.1 hypothetical protein N7517_000287 [Penicillium concentricum]
MTTDTELLSSSLRGLKIGKNSTSSDEEPVIKHPTSLRELIESVLQPALHAQQDFEPIVATHPFFERAKKLCQKHEWPMERFENFQRLLCGTRNFPCILLLNPKNDHLPFDEMVKGTRTLMCLRDVLEDIGLQLDDVIIMDLLPMLTDEWLDEHPDERERVIPEMFQLTLDCIREFKLPIVISCQCFPSFRHERWGSFNHDMVSDLRSSKSSAQCYEVSSFPIGEHLTHCAKGFHPATLYYGEDDNKQKLGEPCAAWRKDYNLKLEERLMHETQSITNLIRQLQQHAAEYDKLRMSEIAQGIFRNGSSTPERWNNPKKALDLILEALSSNTSEKSCGFEDLVKEAYP